MPSNERLSWVYPGSYKYYDWDIDRVNAVHAARRNAYRHYGNKVRNSALSRRRHYDPSDSYEARKAAAEYFAANRIKRFWKKNMDKIREPVEYFKYYN